MFGWSPLAIIIILLAVFLIFGAGKLPDIGSGFGKALKNFKNSLSGKDEIDVTPEEPAPKKKQITRSKSVTTPKVKKTVKSKSTKKA